MAGHAVTQRQINRLVAMLSKFHWLRRIAGGTLLAAFAAITPAQSEIEKFMLDCGGKLCPYFQAPISIPKGWQEDKAATRKMNFQVLVPRGKTFSNAGAIIYVEVRYNAAKAPVESLVAEDHAFWRTKANDVKITQLPEIIRASGKPPFLYYQFEMPSRKSQPFERVATTSDTDKDGNSYIVAVVASARSMKALKEAEAASLSILKSY
jgi:hypothetical protein